MSRAARFLAPLLALAVFAFVTAQTLAALQASGVWSFAARRAWVPPPDPLAALDGVIAKVQSAAFPGAARDPFGYVVVAPRPDPTRTVVRRPVVPQPPPVPVLTAIIFDTDPRAIVRWKGHEYTVRRNGLFEEFVVESIGPDQVVLRHGQEDIVLRRQP